MKPELSLRLQPFGDAVREKGVTVVLPRRDLDTLIDVVENNLAELFVHGHYDRQELMALKRCRSELRAAREPLASTA